MRAYGDRPYYYKVLREMGSLMKRTHLAHVCFSYGRCVNPHPNPL